MELQQKVVHLLNWDFTFNGTMLQRKVVALLDTAKMTVFIVNPNCIRGMTPVDCETGFIILYGNRPQNKQLEAFHNLDKLAVNRGQFISQSQRLGIQCSQW